MKLEKSLYLAIWGHDCEPNMFLKMLIIAVWPVQLDAQAVATCNKMQREEIDGSNKKNMTLKQTCEGGFLKEYTRKLGTQQIWPTDFNLKIHHWPIVNI